MLIDPIEIKEIRDHIQKKCLNCSGFYKKKVQWCKIKDCPLHPFRSDDIESMTKVTEAKLLTSIKKYCLKRCMSDQKNEVKLCPLSKCPLYDFRLGKVDCSVCYTNEVEVSMGLSLM